jgi:hypothetical protein
MEAITMRKITEETKYYFDRNIEKNLGNTRIETFGQFTYIYLFDNLIVHKDNRTGKIEFTLANWNSVTTRERLQAIGVKVSSKQKIPYYNGKAISTTEWVTV